MQKRRKGNKGNKQASSFLDLIEKETLTNEKNKLSEKCKFNFAYFTKQKYSQDLSELTELELKKLSIKLHEYSKESLLTWSSREIGTGKKRGKIFVNYGSFPDSSLMEYPKAIPLEVEWCRFRIDYSFRLVGFIIPSDLIDILHSGTGHRFDGNTFYIVFIDKNHNFYNPV